MKLIRQTRLIQDRSSTQRIHEIDLCEVGDQAYVVNFRYGRAGRRMQEGSLTTAAVDRAQAEKIFRKAVRDKVKKDYYDPNAPQKAPAKKPSPRTKVSKAEAVLRRKKSILVRLRAGDGKYPEWPLNRAIWRAGELAVGEAEPDILRILLEPSGGPLRRYVAIWALGRCGSLESVKAILQSYHNPGETKANRRICVEALLQLLPEDERKQLIATEMERLPTPLKSTAHSGPADAFADALNQCARTDHNVFLDSIYTAYVINNPFTRPAVIDFCNTTPVDSDGFTILRTLYKAAEYRSDGQIFGLLAHKFETSDPAPYHRFSAKTKNYYRWRTWRTLRRMGEQAHAEWVKMAVGTLVPFSNKDSRHGSFGSYWAFNHLLYHNSRVYRPDKTQSCFVNLNRRRQAGPSTHSEEAFAELWDKAPFALLHLLEESELVPVHTFAVRALKRNTPFLSQIDDAAIAMLLLRPIETTAAFGLDLFQNRGDSRAEDSALFLTLADAVHQPARETGWRCIDRHRSELARNHTFWVSLAFSRFADTRRYLKDALKTVLLDRDAARLTVGKLITRLIHAAPEDDVFADVSGLLLQTLSAHTSKLGLDVIRDLFNQTGARYQELAGGLLLANPALSGSVPSDLLFKLLSGPTQSVRSSGVALLNQLPIDDLSERPELFFNLVTSPHADLRVAVRPLIARIASKNPSFSARLGAALVERLRYKDGDDIHTPVRELLQNELRAFTLDLDQKEILRLLNARFVEAKKLGSTLLETSVKPVDLKLSDLNRLVNHEFLKVRQLAWEFCEQRITLIKQDMNKSVRLLDAKWDDSRTFMFQLFGEKLDKTDLRPKILVSICDSVRPDVQQFGRGLITRLFEDRDGPEYLLKLSEHPSPDLQLFATNYLERFASGQVERIARLTPYFVSVLSKINIGRVAKARVLKFLEQEALSSRAVAKVVAPIFTRQSVTIAIENKALMIEAMVRLQSKYPDLELPLSRHDDESRAQEVSSAV